MSTVFAMETFAIDDLSPSPPPRSEDVVKSKAQSRTLEVCLFAIMQQELSYQALRAQ